MEDLEKLVWEAVRLGRAGEWGARSVEVNTKILDLSPDNVPALTRRGRCHYELAGYEAAKADYQRALSLEAGNRIAKNFLRRIEEGGSSGVSAVTRTTQRERVAKRSRRFAEDRAATEYRAARARDTAIVQRDKRWKQEAAQRRVEELTSFAEAFGLAVAAKQGPRPDYPLAIAAFQRAFVLDRSHLDIIVRLAATHRANGDLGEAERLYGWVLEREDNRAARVGQDARCLFTLQEGSRANAQRSIRSAWDRRSPCGSRPYRRSREEVRGGGTFWEPWGSATCAGRS